MVIFTAVLGLHGNSWYEMDYHYLKNAINIFIFVTHLIVLYFSLRTLLFSVYLETAVEGGS